MAAVVVSEPTKIVWRQNAAGDFAAFDTTGSSHVWAPQAGSQTVFLKARETEILYEGNRGPGKTDAVLFDFLQHVGKGFGEDWKGVLFRKSYPDLGDVIEKSRKWVKRIWPAAEYNEAKSFWRWPTGEMLLFRQFAKPADYWKYHGHAYPWQCWEEICTYHDDSCFKSMFSCLRSSKAGMPRKVRATANPYGPGHNWVKLRYRLPLVPGDVMGPPILDEGDDMPRRVVHGHLQENKILLAADPKYVSNIRKAARNPAELAAWLHGDWDIVAGGAIDDIWFEHKKRIVVPRFEVPDDWRIDRAMDWGQSRPTSVGWYAESDGSDLELPGGRTMSTVPGDLFRVDEVYTWTGKPNEGDRSLASDVARLIVKKELERGWRIGDECRVRRGVADSMIFNDENGVCVAKDFTNLVRIGDKTYPGIRWLPADKGRGSRKDGLTQVRQRLRACGPPEGGGVREEPGLFVTDNCAQFLRTVPVLPRDEDDPDDVDTEAEDHVYDEARYRVRFKPPKTEFISRPVY